MRRKINRTSMWLLALTAYFIISFATPALAEERPNIFVQFSHANPVVSITSSQDGRFMLSGDGTTVKLWEIATGREIRTFWGQSTGALSPDGKYVLLTGKKDNSVTLFDINSGLSRSFKGHTDLVYSVAFSPDGKRALSASTDKTIRVWDISTMAEIRSFVAQEEPFKAFSSDGKYFITVTNEKDDSQNYPFTLWDITTGASKHFKGGTYPVRAVAVSSDGKLILTGLSFDKETFLRKEIVKKKGTEPKDEDLLLLWDSASGALIRSFKGIKGPAFSVALSPDARYALSGGMGLYGDQNVTLRLWDVATGSVVWSKKPALIVFSVAFSHDGRYVYGDSYDTLKGKTI
ncbi:MAG TPA: WD40 repeat domain-containing protein, partial [Geobacteraceae bacterium]